MLPYKETYERVKLFGFSFLPLSAVMKKEKYYVVWAGVNPGIYTSWTDCQLQTKGYEGAKYKSLESRGSGKSLCLFAVRVHQTVGSLSCQDYSRHRRSPPHRRRGKQPCRRRGLQRKPRCHGVPGSTRRQPSGNLSLRADVWNQQYRRVPCHCPRTCLVETERFRHAHLQ